MSRIGNRVTRIPAGVTVTQDGRRLTVAGPRGSLAIDVPNTLPLSSPGTRPGSAWTLSIRSHSM